MHHRTKYLDKTLMWLLTVVMILPNFIQAFGNITEVAAATTRVVESILYEGSDGSASVVANLANDGTTVQWEITLNKNPTEEATLQKLEVDVGGGGLGAPHTISSNVTSESKSGIIQLRPKELTPSAQTQIITFTTDVLDTTVSSASLRMLVETVTQETASNTTLHSSPNTKTISLALPILEEPEPEIEVPEEVVEMIEESEEPVEEAVVEEVVPEEEITAPVEEVEEVSEETSAEIESEEGVEETETTTPPEQAESVEEKEEVKEESSSAEEPGKEEESTLPDMDLPIDEVEVVDPNIAEPVSKDYVSRYFSPTIQGLSKFSTAFKAKTTEDNPGSISLDKTAEECEGCRTYQVTLNITGVPPVQPLDVVLMLDRSGSMSENTYTYNAITSTPSTQHTYYVKIDGQYQSVSYGNNRWRYSTGFNWRYVSWSPTGNDSSQGSTNSNNPTPKPFYTRSTVSRMDALKQAAINFASLVLQNPENRVAIVSFAGPSSTTGYGNQSEASTDRNFTNNLTQVQSSINGLTPLNGTNTEAGLRQGNTVFNNGMRQNAKQVAILFTDGLPTASNGNQYNESTNPNSVHFTRAVTASDLIKTYADLYTIGLTQGMNSSELSAARTFLERVQDSGFYEAPSQDQLQQIFESIFSQLDNYGTNAVVQDVIGDDFDLVADSLPSGATYNPTTRTISWSIGALINTPTLTYKVKAKDSVIGSGNPEDKLPTNEWAKLTYTNVNGDRNQEMLFPVPTVHVPLQLEIVNTDVTILKGDSVQLGVGTDPEKENYFEVTGGTGDYTYAWYLGDQAISTEKNPTVNPTTDTTYKVIVTDQKGCKITGYIRVKVKTGSLVVKKIDEQGNLIKHSPATFTLSKDGENTVLSTESSGTVIFTALSKGVYTLTETQAPNGYIKESSVYTVTVEWENGAVKVTVTKSGEEGSPPAVVPSSPLEIVNEKETRDLPVTKHWEDNDDEMALRPENITVHLYQNDMEEPFQTIKIVADEDGNWFGIFKNIPKIDENGVEYVYTVKEEEVTHYDSTVDGFDIYNTLKVGKLTITKVDKSDPSNPILLDGAEFELRNLDGSVVQDGTTVDGKLEFEKVPYGTYQLFETKAPAGYSLPNRHWEITIGGDSGSHIEIEILNTKKQVLPATGGMGTPLFMILGLVLMLGAGVFFKKTKKDGVEKERNKMTKKFRGLFGLLFSLVLLLGAAAPAVSATGKWDNARPLKGDLIIHKTQFHGTEIPNIEDHNGEIIADFPYAPLAGATFTIYKVADDLDVPPADTTGLTAVGSMTTGTNGLATFSNLLAGRYLVVETAQPRGVNYFSPPFLVDVPMTNETGTEWLDKVHVYAKNQVVLASVAFKKWFETGGETKTATFNLYKLDGATETLIESKTVTVTSGDSVQVYFDANDLGLETGNYRIRETSVSDPYGVNATPIDFTVGLEDHDNDLSDDKASINPLGKEVFKNYITSTPEKENTDDDDDENSANYGEVVEWKLSTRIPADISNYEIFTFRDDLDSRLDYVPASVRIEVDGVALPLSVATITEPTTQSGGTLAIAFKPADLAAYAGKTIDVFFDTTINETAVMGEDIPNMFDLEFDNGSGLTTKPSDPDITQTGGAKFDKTSTKDLKDYSGAKFHVYRLVGNTKEYLQADRTWRSGNENPLILTSDKDGNFEIKGLSFGTYFLEEVTALPGHMLRDDFEFEVDDTSYAIDPHNVLNMPQIDLPSTGGFGTIAFTIAGIGMMLGAVKLYRKEEQ
ncbi:SpaA isopeptide-forming pilin-related protein [Jeotgalibaca ciconiae]|uniref:Isopeptide-forming domain-containing fimbrial protein n=1 Tax=Jeotgalibaca ciconiae TaxID=2496265 RepID=A0A3S9H7V2_9LACT|nr:SpaA isopeptide-forming pilin-related protein [Jeotgalibaca ciconiae]AZP03430.1 isopeptide-forming domain-containing fimbrial protein [Jeotgalibaca ciconiae]